MTSSGGFLLGSGLIALGCGLTIKGHGRAMIYSMIWCAYWWVLIASTVTA